MFVDQIDSESAIINFRAIAIDLVLNTTDIRITEFRKASVNDRVVGHMLEHVLKRPDQQRSCAWWGETTWPERQRNSRVGSGCVRAMLRVLAPTPT